MNVNQKQVYTDPVDVQVFQMVHTYAYRVVAPKRRLTEDELDDFISIATLDIMEHISAWDAEHYTLSRFVHNYCRYQETCWYYECRYLLTRSQSRNLHKYLLNAQKKDAADKLVRLWMPSSIESVVENNMEYRVDRAHRDISNDKFDEQLIIESIRQVIETDTTFTDTTKKMLLYWIDNDFDSKKTWEKFNCTRQWLNYAIQELRKKIKSKGIL